MVDESAAATAPCSCLIFHQNRHITFVDDTGVRYHLRPPSIAQWRRIIAAYIAAEARMLVAPDDDPRGPLQRQYGGTFEAADVDDKAPYAEAFAVVVAELSPDRVPADSLPVWAGDASLFSKLYDQWRSARIDVVTDAVEEPDETPPGGYGSVATQTTYRPPAPATDGPPVVVYEPDPEDRDATIPTFDLTDDGTFDDLGGSGGLAAGANPGTARL